MKSRIQFDVVFDSESGQATFPEDLNRWPFPTRVRLFIEIGDKIAARVDEAR